MIYNLGDFVIYHKPQVNYQDYYGRIISILRVDNSQNICIKIECILEFKSLPSTLKSQRRRIAFNEGYLWMTDDTIIINPVNIVSKISIWLTDISKPDNYQHIINEIVYYVNGQWSTRPIDL